MRYDERITSQKNKKIGTERPIYRLPMPDGYRPPLFDQRCRAYDNDGISHVSTCSTAVVEGSQRAPVTTFDQSHIVVYM